MTRNPQWHSEAKLLRAAGIDPRVIAGRLDKSVTAVRWVLDEHGEQAAKRRSVQERRDAFRRATRRKTDRIEQHSAAKAEPRPKSSVVTRETISQAVHDFSEHKIDRATLMDRITPRKWA